MDDNTIKRLNAINREFYATVADEFDTTRGRAWAGWERLVDYLSPSPPTGGSKPPASEKSLLKQAASTTAKHGDLDSFTPPRIRGGAGVGSTFSVLDVGCGNGRLGVFLRDHLPNLRYHGMDNSPALLDHARAALPEGRFEERDIVEHPPESSAYDLVALFGVLHHIPGADRRVELLRALADRVAPGGLLVFAAWRFYEFERFRDRIAAWDTLPDAATLQIEPGDYLLDWRRGERALRYCHYVDDAEHARLIAVTGLAPIADYRADGFTGTVNRYTVLKNVKLDEKSNG